MSSLHRRIQLPDPPPVERARLEAGGVACWKEPLVIDTYEPAAPDRYPLFLDRRVYQGSSGRVYPIPFTDRIETTSRPRSWRAIHLENRWVRLVLLPELGGRIHVGYDKTCDYDFFYRNNVIKPALVGLAGPWVSGGVEFNWPQHHRPATFLPVETCIERAGDDEVVVWHSDLDPLQRMRGTHGVRLRGDSSAIELEARLVNRTDVPQTFLWWSNVAARSHERYQSFFPTDVRYVADHARRAITAFPAADRPYYGVDYPALAAERPGADRIDVYANIPVPTSYMITDTADDFFGGYDHEAGAGFVHWADRAIAPGKKQWTWGAGEVGQAWDRHLTDGDGPYVELMAGVFTDNQPDFSWLAPGETRRFSQFWYPIQGIGPAVQATLDAAIGLESDASSARLGVVTTAEHDSVRVVLRRRGGADLGEWVAAIAPGAPFTVDVALGAHTGVASRDDLEVDVVAGGRVLVAWRARAPIPDEPWVATEPPEPAEIAGADELVLTGLHLVQYRHPTRSAERYFLEAVRRDPGDSRARLQLARIALARGELGTALEHVDIALARLTHRNLNPEHGDAHLLRALVLERLGRREAAAEAFGKAGWDGALALPSALGRARLAMRAGDPELSLASADTAVGADPASPAAIASRIVALRALGRHAAAGNALAAARADDPLDPLLAALDDDLDPVDPRTLLTMAHEVFRMGDRARGLALAERAAAAPVTPFGNPAPLAGYALASFLDEVGRPTDAAAARIAAAAADPTLAFPHGLDDLRALEAALAADPDDARAAAYRGCWLLDAGRASDALEALDAAITAGIDDPVAWRNAAVALVNVGGDLGEADRRYAEALRRSPGDARLVFERDQLAALRHVPASDRLAVVAAAGPEVLVRDDLAISYANLLVDVGRAADALAFLGGRAFQPFEGGEGQVIRVFDRASVAVARELLAKGDGPAAVELLRDGIRVPEHLGEGRHPAEPVAERFVLLGDALEAMGEHDAAREAWRSALGGGPLAAASRAPDERDAWVGVAHARLGDASGALAVWRSLEERADALEAAADRIDYFATSVPELLLFQIDTAERRRATADRLRELAAAGRLGAVRAA